MPFLQPREIVVLQKPVDCDQQLGIAMVQLPGQLGGLVKGIDRNRDRAYSRNCEERSHKVNTIGKQERNTAAFPCTAGQ